MSTATSSLRGRLIMTGRMPEKSI